MTVTRAESISRSASAARAARNSSGRAVVVRSPVIRTCSGARPRTRSTTACSRSSRNLRDRPVSNSTIPTARLLISRSGLNEYCQTWMSDRWTIRNRLDSPPLPRHRPDASSSEMPAEPADQEIISSMRANRDAKTADDEDPGEVDAGQPAEDEGGPGERLAGQPHVVRDREEQGRRRDRQAARQDGRRLQEPQGAEE